MVYEHGIESHGLAYMSFVFRYLKQSERVSAPVVDIIFETYYTKGPKP